MSDELLKLLQSAKGDLRKLILLLKILADVLPILKEAAEKAHRIIQADLAEPDKDPGTLTQEFLSACTALLSLTKVEENEST